MICDMGYIVGDQCYGHCSDQGHCQKKTGACALYLIIPPGDTPPIPSNSLIAYGATPILDHWLWEQTYQKFIHQIMSKVLIVWHKHVFGIS